MLSDYTDPKWHEATKVHDWRNHVSDELREMWHTFTDTQKAAIARQADDHASNEEWE